MTSTKFEITGLADTLDVFKQLQSEIGDKEARSKVLIPAVKEAMKPVLNMARMLAPHDTNALRDTLGIVGRRPTNRDKRSKYVTSKDSVIAIVTTKNIPKKLKKEFAATHTGLKGKELRRAKQSFYASHNIPYDARAVSQEFGTAKIPAQPFMRPAMESQASSVATKLGEILKLKIEQYRSKTRK